MIPAADGLALYYMGWNLGVRSPWHNAIGLARAQSLQGAFERFSAGPILDRSPEDPYTLSYPCVLQLGAHDWRMWYGSNLAPGTGKSDMQHAIKMARSADGVGWTRDGATAIGFADASEYALARPSVIKLGSKLLMCFACRGEAYRIGAAMSEDGVSWTRRDQEFGLDRTGDGWDSEMTCYACIQQVGSDLLMFYNGNGFGRSGVGSAVLEHD